MSSLLAKGLRGLKSQCRILLTGTPVQNALQDFLLFFLVCKKGVEHLIFSKRKLVLEVFASIRRRSLELSLLKIY